MHLTREAQPPWSVLCFGFTKAKLYEAFQFHVEDRPTMAVLLVWQRPTFCSLINKEVNVGFDLRQALLNMHHREPMDPSDVIPLVQTRRLRFDPPFVVSVQSQGSHEPSKKGILLATRWNGRQCFLIATDTYVGEVRFSHRHQCLRLHSCILTSVPEDASTLEGRFSFYGYKDFDQWTPFDHRPMNV